MSYLAWQTVPGAPLRQKTLGCQLSVVRRVDGNWTHLKQLFSQKIITLYNFLLQTSITFSLWMPARVIS